MSQQSAARHEPPQTAQKQQAAFDRDTLEAIDQDFLRDQLEALLASPALAKVAERHSEGRDNPADFDSADFDRDTEPSVDTRLLREALKAGLNK